MCLYRYRYIYSHTHIYTQSYNIHTHINTRDVSGNFIYTLRNMINVKIFTKTVEAK